MKGPRLQAHLDMKRRVQEILDGLQGADIHLKALRERLLLSPSNVEGCNVLKKALEDLRHLDRKAAPGRFKGWWKSATPHQQPLPVGASPSLLALTGLKPETVDALRERLAHARQKHPNKEYTGLQWLTALLKEGGEVSEALCGGDEEGESMAQVVAWQKAVRDEFLDVATVALRAFEEWSE